MCNLFDVIDLVIILFKSKIVMMYVFSFLLEVMYKIKCLIFINYILFDFLYYIISILYWLCYNNYMFFFLILVCVKKISEY